MSQAQWFLKSKVGPLYLVASAKGLRALLPEKQDVPMAKSLSDPAPEVSILARAAAQLEEYFDGRRRSFDLPLDRAGTDFQMSVWKQLGKIPYGKTASYRDIARQIKNEHAVRAVGGANGKNPLCIIVPCHRVIASDGSLGGYSGGLGMKSKLLELERSL